MQRNGTSGGTAMHVLFHLFKQSVELQTALASTRLWVKTNTVSWFVFFGGTVFNNERREVTSFGQGPG